MKHGEKISLVLVWKRSALTLDATLTYSGLGRHTSVEYSNETECNFTIWIGRKRFLKRKKSDEFIEKNKII